MQLSRIFEVFASFSLLKFITDWRHENTMREQSRLQAQIEMKRIDGERRKEWIEVVRLLIMEGHTSKEMSAKIVRTVLTDDRRCARPDFVAHRAALLRKESIDTSK